MACFPMFWDAKTGHLYLQVNKFDQDFLFLPSLPYGLGSNDIGLDRGRLGEGSLVHFSRVGPRCCSFSRISITARRRPTRQSAWR